MLEFSLLMCPGYEHIDQCLHGSAHIGEEF
jgi:hypothetical protein